MDGAKTTSSNAIHVRMQNIAPDDLAFRGICMESQSARKRMDKQGQCLLDAMNNLTQMRVSEECVHST
jgi:hypothetical protein